MSSNTESSTTAMISACILVRNEEKRIEDAIQCLQGWTDQIIVIDNESHDDTVAIARRYTEHILSAPCAANFDAARNLAIPEATGDWIFFLDADERVPAELGLILRQLVQEHGHEFEALVIPFRHFFCGKWMEHSGWWPGYTRPQLLKKGRFHYNDRLHSGVHVDGQTRFFPATDPQLAIAHYSYDNLHHYLAKLNAYTDGEAESLLVDGQSHSWQAMLAHFVQDWQICYERGRADLDGMHGFVLSFLSAFYRFASRAKLWDLRRQRGEISKTEPVPASIREMLEFMAQASQEGSHHWLTPPATGAATPERTSGRVPLLWCAPFHDPSGYADEARNFVFSLWGAGEPLAICPMLWSEEDAGLSLQDRHLLDQHSVRYDTPCELFISQTTPPLNRPNPHAQFNIARTMFETDRLQPGWEQSLNQMDRIWVPSEFNRGTFVRSGVDPQKIAVVPECLDVDAFSAEVAPWPLPGTEKFKFLSVFDWTRHKGWDVLLPAFAQEFADSPDVGLVLKVWSSNGYRLEDIRAQADACLQEALGKGLSEFPNIHLWQEKLASADMPRLYRAVDAFVIPSRGEGWCRPLMEAMASGLPTIATAWSGLTAFHHARVGYPLKYKMVPVTEAGAKEIPIYAGHQWAEPDVTDLRRLMRKIVRNPAAARKKGAVAKKAIVDKYARPVVARLLQEELERCRVLAREKAALTAEIKAINADAELANTSPRNTLLVQCVQGEQESLLELTRAYHGAYAKAHNMDYFYRFGAQQERRHPYWDKIAILKEVLQQTHYEYVVWLDADTLIVDPKQDLRKALPGDKWLGLVTHGNPPYFNSGVLYLRNTVQCRAFFEAIWQTWPVDNAWEDNAALIQVLEHAPDQWAGVVTLDDAWNSTHKVNESPQPIVEGWHGYGTSAQRLSSMQAAMERIATQRTWLNAQICDLVKANILAPSHQIQAAAGRQEEVAQEVLPFRPPANLVVRDPSPAVDFQKTLGRQLRVRWEGDQAVRSSLALVNREICLQILARGDVELSLADTARIAGEDGLMIPDDPRFDSLFARRQAQLTCPVDITIRHHFPPNWQKPESGKLVMIAPWEWGHLPKSWVEGAAHHADEVWAYSRFVRDVYVRSGVPAEKVKIVPLGVRPEVFTPQGHPFPLATKKTLRFLFVGGTIDRKGANLLLKAYRRAFTRADDLCLVVKDMGVQTFYRRQNFADAFRQAQADPNGPEVLYLDDDLSDEEMAALYRACDCVVLPYRGEGFALSPLEGMACGLPAIVTAGGPTDDYLDDALGLRVPFRIRSTGQHHVGPFECVGDPWNLEPDLKALVDALHWVRNHPEETKQRGEASASYVQDDWTWQQSADIACARLQALTGLGNSSVSSESATPWPAPHSAHHSDTPLELDAAPIELSLCMIARDEEARIGACLQSIAPYVDEMIVVDTGSTDRTREIAAQCGARVFDFPWTDSFAQARNQSLAQARGKWIFWMDADDVITPECTQGLRELIQRHPQCDAAFQVQVRIPPGPGEFSASLVDHVKLFPNRQDLRFEHRIHEQILPSLRQARLPVLFSDLYVTHENYDRSPAGQAKKRRRDFRLLEMDLADHPDHPFVLFNLGMTSLYANKDYEVAAHYLRRSLDGSDPRDSIVRKAYALLTTARLCQQDWSAALRANEEGRKHYPNDAELLFQAGQIYQNVDRFAEARQALERLVSGTEGRHYRSADSGLRTYRGQHELALLFRRLGDALHCERVLRDVAGNYPDYLPAQLDLVETMLIQGKCAEAQEYLAQIPVAPGIEGSVQRLRQLLK